MGIENRDYVRGGSSGYGGYATYGGYGSGRMPPACKWFLILNIVVFVLQLLWTAGPTDTEMKNYQSQLEKQYRQLRNQSPEEANREIEFALHEIKLNVRYSVIGRAFELAPQKIFPGFQLWRLVTYAFCHDKNDVFHIIFNMLALWFFGPTLERMYGTREFAWFYLMAAVVSGLAFVGLELILGSLHPVIGASGAIMAVLMLYAIHYPRQIIRIWGIIPIEVRWIVGFYLIYDLYPVLKALGGDSPGDHVAHAAHLGGLAFGYAYFKYQLQLERLFRGLKVPNFASREPRPMSRGNLRLYEPPSAEDLDNQVDAILEKISQTGEASLTDQEREILKAASNRYKKRS